MGVIFAVFSQKNYVVLCSAEVLRVWAHLAMMRCMLRVLFAIFRLDNFYNELDD